MARNANSEGSIYKRWRDGRHVGYVGAISLPDGKRVRVYGRTRQEAREKLAAARARVEAGSPVRDSSRSVASWLSHWRATTLEASARKPATRELYANLSRKHLEPEPFGAVPLDKLRPSDAEALILALRKKNLSPSTIRSAYTVLRAALDGAVRDGLVARNVAAAVPRPGLPRREARHLTGAEVSAVLTAASESRYYLALLLCAATGLRKGELLALKWTALDLTGGALTVRSTLSRIDGQLVISEPKSARSRRVVPIPAALIPMLTAHRTAHKAEKLRAANVWQEHGLVFTTETGRPVDPRSFLRVLEKAAAAAGVEGVGVHTLRHSAAVSWLEGGVHIKQVADLLGHSSVAITGDVYGHGSEDGARKAVEQLMAGLPSHLPSTAPK